MFKIFEEHAFAVIIVLIIVFVALFGGVKNIHYPTPVGPTTNTTTPVDQNLSIQDQIKNTQAQIDDLKNQLNAVELAKTQSVYKNIVSLGSLSHSDNANQEYVTLRISSGATTTVPITGWTLRSKTTGVSVTIGKATGLFFTGMLNSEDNVVLSPGDTAYIITGISPNGVSFRVNKCSGYTSQFQSYTPGLYTSCPSPGNEDLSSIPDRVENDACLQYIRSFPSCRIQTNSLPANWSYECTKFIYDKINYGSCVNVHKNDPNFYQHDWRLYLKRGSPIWRGYRETIELVDTDGKIVSTLTY